MYTNKVKEATYKKLEDNRYEVTLEVESIKNYFDGNGKLLDTGTRANLLEIGIFDEEGKNDQGMTVKVPIVLEKVWVEPGTNTFTYLTDKLPAKAGIDPYNKMIDRIPDDNVKRVVEAD